MNNSYRPGVMQASDVGTQFPGNMNQFTITGNRAFGSATAGSTNSTVTNNLNQTHVSTPVYAGGAN